jgi:HK97 family phage portal protein
MMTSLLTAFVATLPVLPKSVRTRIQNRLGRTQERIFSRGSVRANTAQQYVSPITAEQLSAVLACMRYRADMISIMPWRVIETTSENDRLLAVDHPIDPILSRMPNTETTPSAFKSALVTNLLGWGDCYAEIVRDGVGRIRALSQIESHRVLCYRDAASGEIRYDVMGTRTGTMTLEVRDMFHVAIHSLNGITGRSPLLIGSQPIGGALAADRFAGSFFGNGATPQGYLRFAKYLEKDVRDQMREEWYQQYGGVHQAGGVAVIGEDGKFEPVTVDPAVSQVLETRRWGVVEICRLLNVPPQKVYEYSGQGATASASINATIVTESHQPLMTSLEEQANLKLIGQPRFSTKLNANALLRGTPQERAQIHRTYVQLGARSVNEVRRLEEAPGIGEAGDVFRMPLNMTTAEKFAAGLATPPTTPPGPGDGSSGGPENQPRE